MYICFMSIFNTCLRASIVLVLSGYTSPLPSFILLVWCYILDVILDITHLIIIWSSTQFDYNLYSLPILCYFLIKSFSLFSCAFLDKKYIGTICYTIPNHFAIRVTSDEFATILQVVVFIEQQKHSWLKIKKDDGLNKGYVVLL